MKINFHDTAQIQLMHPATGAALVNDEGAPITVTAYGPQSKQFIKAKRQHAANQIVYERMAREQDDDSNEITRVEAIEESATAMLQSVIVSIDGGEGVEFQDIPVSMDNLDRLLTEVYWFRDQIDLKVGSAQLFLAPDPEPVSQVKPPAT